MTKNILTYSLFPLCLLVFTSVLARHTPGQQQQPLPVVEVETAKKQKINPEASFAGRVEAVNTAKIISRVQGFITDIRFSEGSVVKAGQQLFSIEKSSYEIALKKAEANVQSATATVDLNSLNLKRKQKLYNRRSIARSELDTAKANMKSADARLKLQQAEREDARINLSYTDIKSPIDGKIGISQFSKGEYVTPTSGELAVVVSQNPMRVTFPIPQAMLLRILRQKPDSDDVKVQLILGDGKAYGYGGKLLFFDPQANIGTDSVTARALFPNPDGILFDKQLVKVISSVTAKQAKVIVSQKALTLNQSESYVLIVNEDSVVERKKVKTGQRSGPYIEITSGINEGDRVIVTGLNKVKSGSKVKTILIGADSGG